MTNLCKVYNLNQSAKHNALENTRLLEKILKIALQEYGQSKHTVEEILIRWCLDQELVCPELTNPKMREQTDATKNNQRNDFVESETVSTDTDDENPIIPM